MGKALESVEDFFFSSTYYFIPFSHCSTVKISFVIKRGRGNCIKKNSTQRTKHTKQIPYSSPHTKTPNIKSALLLNTRQTPLASSALASTVSNNPSMKFLHCSSSLHVLGFSHTMLTFLAWLLHKSCKITNLGALVSLQNRKAGDRNEPRYLFSHLAPLSMISPFEHSWHFDPGQTWL